MKKEIFYLVIVFATLIFITLLISKNTGAPTSEKTVKQTLDKPDAGAPIKELKKTNKQYNRPPEVTIDPKKNYTATLKTNLGDITIQLYADKTPITVNNFVFLAREGFYNNTIFHRVIKGFMIQGGDPLGDGTGGPGYQFFDEQFEGEYTRGTVAMANAGPNTNGSQFFIMHQDTPLPKNYVIFGKVISGIETVDKIAAVEVLENASGELSKPKQPVTIKTVEITEN